MEEGIKIEKIKLKLNKIKLFMNLNIVEILLIVGLFFIVTATFMINTILALYVIGIIFVALAIFLIKYPNKNMRGR